MIDVVRGARKGVVVGLAALGACTSSAPAGSDRVESAGLQAPAWPEGLDCASTLRWLADAASRGTLPSSPASAPIALVTTGGDEAASAAGTVDLVVDLPLPQGNAAAPGASCLVVVDTAAAMPEVERRIIRRGTEVSEREGRIERHLNPDYEIGRRELVRLADRLDREDREQQRDVAKLPATGNLLVDAAGLVGGLILSGVGAVARDREVEEAKARVAAIPKWIEERQWEPYSLQATETDLVRRASVRVALVDEAGGRQWRADRILESHRLFLVPDGLHPRDRSIVESTGRFARPGELDAFETAPLTLRLSEVLAPLAARVAAEAGSPGGLADLQLAWARSEGGAQADLRPTAPPTRLAASLPTATSADRGRAAPSTGPRRSFVKISGVGGEGHGFYVARDKIVTLRRLLGQSSLARVEAADGFVTWGVIDREERGSEIVRLHVQRGGPPLEFAHGDPTVRAVGGDLPAPGLPVLAGGRIVAVSVDPASRKVVPGAEVERLLVEAKGP